MKFPLPTVQTDEVGLDRRVQAISWFAPGQVDIRGDRLVWDYYAKDGVTLGPEVQLKEGLLEQFVGLADAPAERIRDFAARWGVLLICEHRLPISHNPPPLIEYDGEGLRCELLGLFDGPRQPWELLEVWRQFSGQAFALMKIANRLMLGQVGRPEDWKIVYARTGQTAPWWRQSVDVEKWTVAEVVNEWLILGNVRPRVEWPMRPDRYKRERPYVKLGGSHLFGALAVQLALAVGQTEGMAICTHCRNQYIPSCRSAKARQRNFCPDCRQAGIPGRYALDDHRERKRKNLPFG
jgi:hypothetical protein